MSAISQSLPKIVGDEKADTVIFYLADGDNRLYNLCLEKL